MVLSLCPACSGAGGGWTGTRGPGGGGKMEVWLEGTEQKEEVEVGGLAGEMDRRQSSNLH